MKALILLLLASLGLLAASAPVDLASSVQITWGDRRAMILPGGSVLQLALDRSSGSGFQTKQEFLFGRIDMQIKVVPGNSAGTVTAYYMSSQGTAHDEIDFEFLGNLSADPYTLHTNVYSQGKGGREQQFRLWFDPRLDYHTYSILWNPTNIIWLVDNTPIRVFRNLESRGIPFPKSQPMRLYSSLWSGEDWATRGGLVKTDWSKAPFIATYRNFNVDACVATSLGGSSCPSTKGAWWTQTLDAAGLQKLRQVRQNNMIYDYCTDAKRFPQGFPPECSDKI